MNKHQIISQANRFLESKGFKNKDYSVDAKGPDIILSPTGEKKMTEEIKNKLLDMRINIQTSEGVFTPEVRQATPQETKPADGAKPKAQKESVMVATMEELTVGKKFETPLTSPLEVFGKKDVAGKSAKMQPCAAVIYSKLAEVDGEGNSIISVKKPGSTRVFYTTENRLPVATVVEEAAPAEVPAEEPAKETAEVAAKAKKETKK